MTLEVKNPNDLPLLSIKELIPTQGDLKDLTEANYDKLKKSFEKHGFIFPISIWQDGDKNYLIDGHQRQRVITKEYGDVEVPVIRIPAKDIKEAAEILLKVTSQYGTITQEGLDTYIATYELPEVEIYEATHYDAISYLQQEEPEIEEDEAPEVSSEPPLSQLGVVYQLGRHKIACGSSTDEDVVNNLFGELNLDLYLTDPPYNVDYTGKTKDALKIDNDSMDDVEFLAFLTDANRRADEHMKSGAAFYIFHADSEGYNFRASVRDTGWMLKQCLIWVKQSMVMGRQDYQWQHEPILYGWKSGSAHAWYSDRKQTTILNFDRPSRSEEHPTMKPINILAYLIKNSTKSGDIVYDAFSGSGSGLIACEQTDRTFLGCELDSRFVDVIRKRYAKFTAPDNQLPENWGELTPAIQGNNKENNGKS